MSLIFDQTTACVEQIVKKFHDTGVLSESTENKEQGLNDLVFTSANYRRAHVSVVDARESKKLWLLHVTVFPNVCDSSPIYGFDIVAGPNKVSGAFHDFSSNGDSSNLMMQWFAEKTAELSWNKKRELPDWAKNIFSPSMVAIGAVGTSELADFISLGLETLDYYLANVGKMTTDDTKESQNFYCLNQQQNPHTLRVLVTLGFTQDQAMDFVKTKLFPTL